MESKDLVSGILENSWTCGKSDRGRKRTQNEDTCLIIDGAGEHHDTRKLGMMFAVADSMGGLSGGVTAIGMAFQGLCENYYWRAECEGAFWTTERAMTHLGNAV